MWMQEDATKVNIKPPYKKLATYRQGAAKKRKAEEFVANSPDDVIDSAQTPSLNSVSSC